MQTLLNDIELDVQELKCLVQAIAADANPLLRVVARRNISQMQERLKALEEWLDKSAAAADPKEPEPVTAVEEEPEPIAPILAERIMPAADLRHAISLNDSFRFARELFGGDVERMNETVRRLGEAGSLDAALDIFAAAVHVDEENAAAADFVELLKKYFS